MRVCRVRTRTSAECAWVPLWGAHVCLQRARALSQYIALAHCTRNNHSVCAHKHISHILAASVHCIYLYTASMLHRRDDDVDVHIESSINRHTTAISSRVCVCVCSLSCMLHTLYFTQRRASTRARVLCVAFSFAIRTCDLTRRSACTKVPLVLLFFALPLKVCSARTGCAVQGVCVCMMCVLCWSDYPIVTPAVWCRV